MWLFLEAVSDFLTNASLRLMLRSMLLLVRRWGLASVFSLAFSGFQVHAQEAQPLSVFEDRARDQGRVFPNLELESSPAEVEAHAERVMASVRAGFDEVAGLPPEARSYESIVARLEQARAEAWDFLGHMELVSHAHRDGAIRNAAATAFADMEKLLLDMDQRRDVYEVFTSFADSSPALEGESARVFADIARDYRRAGMELDETERERVASLQRRLIDLTSQFDQNLRETEESLRFTAHELRGVPQTALDDLERDGEDYLVPLHDSTKFGSVVSRAEDRSVRTRLVVARNQMLNAENTVLLDAIGRLRFELAQTLGYATWADYQNEVRARGTLARSEAIRDEVGEAFEQRFIDERARIRIEMAAHLSRPVSDSDITSADLGFYADRIRRREYDIDHEELRKYFEMERVLAELFKIIEEFLGLRFEAVEGVDVWAEGVRSYVVTRPATGEVVGLVHLDLFPREGKYKHFAHFGMSGGYQNADGTRQIPRASLVCNFPAPKEGRPSLMRYGDVITLFHEFGHLLHTLFGQTENARYSGTNVEHDAVEIPSQIFEALARAFEVVQRFAVNHEDPSDRMDEATLLRIREAGRAFVGTMIRRQMSLVTIDLDLHGRAAEPSSRQISNDAFTRWSYAPIDPRGNFASHFGHLTHYDGGYLDYMSADMAVYHLLEWMRAQPGGLLSPDTWRQFADGFMSLGGAVGGNELIANVAGPDPVTIQPMLRYYGLAPAEGDGCDGSLGAAGGTRRPPNTSN